ncbi:MAG: peptidase M22 [Clostridia bacterium]|nr:peptidase M22 [Clostridia bacterium]
MNRLFVGLDTSNYTTSAAICDETGEVLCNEKLPLPVAQGERGLRQSDAVFAHVRALPEAAASLRKTLTELGADPLRIAAIGVSYAPRDAQGSYMPCFLSGIAAAETAGALLGVPVMRFSHQAGHIMAALHSAGALHLIGREFAAFHVSGGTTDVLYVRPHEEYVFAIDRVGGTEDINAGQAIDRAGVHMGLRFPAGAEMERLAQANTKKIPKTKITVRGISCNLSGLENKAVKLYAETEDKALVSAFVLDFVGRTLCGLRDGMRQVYGSLPVIYAGGVMSCGHLHEMLSDENAYFAQPRFSSDNAAGTALLARHQFLLRENNA